LLHIRDGGEGDADGVVNGRIVDPFGVSAAAADGDESGSGDGILDGDGDMSPPFGGCIYVPGSDTGSGWFLLLGLVLLGLAMRMILTRGRN
jgi:hypothetical protein